MSHQIYQYINRSDIIFPKFSDDVLLDWIFYNFYLILFKDEDDYESDCEAEGEDGVMILRAGDGKRHKAKLLQFHENQRYWKIKSMC